MRNAIKFSFSIQTLLYGQRPQICGHGDQLRVAGHQFLIDSLFGLNVKERVTEVVTATDDLDVAEVVTVAGGEAGTAVVNLTGEDFVTEEVVTEDSTVVIGEVVGISHGHIGKITEESVHRVVLLFDIVEMRARVKIAGS